MIYLKEIRNQIQALYQSNPIIHVNRTQSSPQIVWKHTQATIVGVYPNFIRIEIVENGHKNYYSIQYAEILIARVKIDELNVQW